MPRKYRYYNEPEDTPESNLWGGVGRGIQSGIELVMESKLKQSIKDKEREQRREEEATEISDKALLDERKLTGKRAYDLEQQIEKEKRANEEYDRRKESESRKSKGITDPLGEARKYDALIKSVMETKADPKGILDPQSQSLVDYYTEERNKLTGVPSYVKPAEIPEQGFLGRRAAGIGGQAITGLNKLYQRVGDKFRKPEAAPIAEPPVEPSAEPAALPPDVQASVDKLQAAGALPEEIDQYIRDKGY